jgi:phosphoserine phosphatase RsbU/P
MTPHHDYTKASSEHGRVLVVDDDPDVASSFRKVLERYGHTVFVATNGHDGLEMAARESPEILLLDLKMPAMGGLEMLNQCAHQFPDLPAIIISGTSDMNDAIQALRHGACDYLTKPVVEPEMLIRTVERNLEKARLIRQNRQVHEELQLHLERMYEEEEAGRRIQARLFPPPQWTFGPYHFEQRVVPSLVLSGDMPDYFAVDDRYAVCYCADVAGHGVSSALITVMVKSLVAKHREHYRSQSDSVILQPAQMLLQLNKELLAERLGRHLTLFYAVLDQQANTLCFAGGGHYPPPMLFTETGLELLNQKSMAVGLFPFAQFKTDTVALPQAFRLVLVSDGALDALTSLAPDARLAHLQGLRTPQAWAQFVDTAAQADLPDDLTFLSVTRGDAL